MYAVKLRAGMRSCPSIRELWLQGPRFSTGGVFFSGVGGTETPFPCWLTQMSKHLNYTEQCIPLLVSAGRYSVTAVSKLFSLYSSGINECELSSETLLFLSLFIPLNKARLHQVASLYFHHPCEMECVCKERCDKDKLLSLPLPAPEVQVGKSLMQTWTTEAKEQQLLLSRISR